MKISELAKSLNKKSAELIKVLNDNGESFKKGSHSKILTDDQVEMVKNHFESMHLRIREIQIYGLWGRKQLKIELTKGGGFVTLCHGVNGIGKTTILELLKEIYGKDHSGKFYRLNRTEFKLIEISYLDSREKFKITKRQSDIEFCLGKQKAVYSFEDQLLRQEADEHLKWMSERNMVLKRARGQLRGIINKEATSKYYRDLEITDEDSLLEEEPLNLPIKADWLEAHVAKINLLWLDTKRLDFDGLRHIFKHDYQRKKQASNSLNLLSEELKYLISKALEDYNHKQSQGLEQLPTRISEVFRDRVKIKEEKGGIKGFEIKAENKVTPDQMLGLIGKIEESSTEAREKIMKLKKPRNAKEMEKQLAHVFIGILPVILESSDLMPIFFGLDPKQTEDAFNKHQNNSNDLFEKGILTKLQYKQKHQLSIPGFKAYDMIVKSELSRIFQYSQKNAMELLRKINSFENFANKCMNGKRLWVGKFGIKVELIKSQNDHKRWTLQDAERNERSKEKNPQLELEDLSSGEQHLLVMFFVITFLTTNTLIVIDEPEISLHTAWQENFMSQLEEVCENSSSYALIATHSPDIAACVDSRNCVDIYQD